MSNKPPEFDLASQWAASGMTMLNGVFGNFLPQNQNVLAVDMALMYRDKPLALDRSSLSAVYPDTHGKLCILIHGLCCTEHSWAFTEASKIEDSSYGTLLRDELGFTPLSLRYNTLLPIAENGKCLDALLEKLLAVYPVAVTEIVLIGHSMGGLVICSACEQACQRQDAVSWLSVLRKVFYVGTPHEGPDLSKLTQATTAVFDAISNPIARAMSDAFNWHTTQTQTGGVAMAPLPEHIEHYLIAGTLHEDPEHIVNQLFGDGLVHVPLGSGGQSGNENHHLPDEHIKIFPGLHHMALARDRAVYAQIKQWVEK